jgi:predicted DNA-binding protein
MLAVKIDDPWLEQRLSGIAKQQHKSRQTIVRNMIHKQIEDAEDYAAAVAASARLDSGETTAIPLEEVMKRYGMEH